MNATDPVVPGGHVDPDAAPETPTELGSFSLPDAPGFPTLVRIHLRGLWKEFPVAWIGFGVLATLLPAAALLYRGDPVGPEGPSAALAIVMTLVSLLVGLTVIVAFLWPDAVWRNLPPGGRTVMDALPVSRRVHRLARVTAGLVLPLGIAISVGATATILESGPGSPTAFGFGGLGAEGSGLAGALIAMGSLTAAYLLSTALAIRFGRVLLGLFTLAAGGTLLVFLLVMMGWDAAAIRIQQWLFLGHWAPGRTLVLSRWAELADLGPVLLWLVILSGITAAWAGRHDRP